MPNHAHLILVPADPDALRRTLAATHRRYAGHIHARFKRTRHFWQGRFGCVAMDETHLGAALRYVALNPVRARLTERALDWPWSSVHVHLGRVADDGLTAREPVLSRYPDFAELIAAGKTRLCPSGCAEPKPSVDPWGGDAFIAGAERESERSLKPAKRGPVPKGGVAKSGALSP